MFAIFRETYTIKTFKTLKSRCPLVQGSVIEDLHCCVKVSFIILQTKPREKTENSKQTRTNCQTDLQKDQGQKSFAVRW